MQLATSLDWIVHRPGHLHPLNRPPGDAGALQLGPLEAADVVFVVPLVDGREGPTDQLYTAAAAGLGGSAGRPAGILGRYHSADHGVRERRGLNTQQSAAAKLGGENGGILAIATTGSTVAVGIGNTCRCSLCLSLTTFGCLVRGSSGSRYRRRAEEDMHRGIAVVLNVAGKEVAFGRRAHVACFLG